VVFRSDESFSTSAANRDALKKFFAEVANDETLGVERVWIPGGLWEVRSAAKLASELNVTLAFDPLVREPGEPAEIFHDLDLSALYLRVESAGRARAIRNEQLEDIAMLLEHYEALSAVVSFASPERWQDARNLMKLLRGEND